MATSAIKSLITAAQFLLLHIIVFYCNSPASAETEPIHLSLNRRPVSSSRVFTHSHRPWALHAAKYAPNHRPYVPKKRTAVNSTLPYQPMFGGISTVGEYFLAMQFGGQTIHVQIDTGSATLAVPLKQCINCRDNDRRFDLKKAKGTTSLIRCDSPACQRNSCNFFPECRVCSTSTRACCSLVVPKACGFFLRYADGSAASGALIEAEVTLAALTAPVMFGGVLLESKGFEASVVDGIFGMAYKSLACNPTCVTPLFDTLVKTGKVKRDVFALCTGKEGGTLTLGGSNSHQYEGQLQYVKTALSTPKQFYDVRIEGAIVGDKKIDLPQFSAGIVDSGTTVLVITLSAYRSLKTYFMSNFCSVPGLCPERSEKAKSRLVRKVDSASGSVKFTKRTATARSSTSDIEDDDTWFSPINCMPLTKEEVAKLPNITVVLEGGVKLTVEPEDYMLTFEVDSTPWSQGMIFRCLGIVPLPGLEHFPNNVIIGDTVLQKYYFEIDREKSRVGFAPSKNCVLPKKMLTSFVQPVTRQSNRLFLYGPIILAVSAVLAYIFIRLWSGAKRLGYSEIANSS